jgi:hypothetical protein
MFRVNLFFQGLQICQRFVKGGSMHVTPFAGGQCGLLLLLMDQGIDGVMKASAADAGNQATSWRQYVHDDLVTENPLQAGE